MIPKSKSCPNIFLILTLKTPPSYGTFLKMFPEATKGQRCNAITNFYRNLNRQLR